MALLIGLGAVVVLIAIARLSGRAKTIDRARLGADDEPGQKL